MSTKHHSLVKVYKEALDTGSYDKCYSYATTYWNIPIGSLHTT